MVWNMKWMTRYFNFIARPIIQLVADNEVIACGLRTLDGKVNIIYSPTTKQNSHKFFKLAKKGDTEETYNDTQNFSQHLVHQKILPNAQTGEIYRIKAKSPSGRTLKSPKIYVKDKTKQYNDLLEIKSLPDNEIEISWKQGKTLDAMIHFLVIEDENNRSITGIYTREHTFIYPKVKTASLTIGNFSPNKPKTGEKYTFRLVFVDYDGWVPYLAEKSFIYN